MYLGEPHRVLLGSKVFKRLGEEKDALRWEDQGRLHVGSSIWASFEGQAAFGQKEIHSRQRKVKKKGESIRKCELNLGGGGGGRGCTEPALTLKGEEREMRWKCPMGLHRGGHLVFRCLGRLDPEGDGKIIDKFFKRKLS